VIFDAGVFIALDNTSQREIVQALVRKMAAEGIVPSANEAVVAQAWRDPAKQVPLTMLLKAVTVYPFGNPRTIGQRCALTDTTDVVDTSLAVLSDRLNTTILTTDPDDMAKLGANFETL